MPSFVFTIVYTLMMLQYHSRDEFLSDVGLIYKNCARYNGNESVFTATAKKIVDITKQCLEENSEQITEWEEGIKLKQVWWLHIDKGGVFIAKLSSHSPAVFHIKCVTWWDLWTLILLFSEQLAIANFVDWQDLQHFQK